MGLGGGIQSLIARHVWAC